MKRCCGRDLARKGDSPDDIVIKEVGFRLIIVVAIFEVFAMFSVLTHYTALLGIGLALVASVFFLVTAFLNLAPARYVLDIFLVLTTVGIWGMDLENKTMSGSFRSWSFIILVLDASLVFHRSRIQFFIIPGTLLYLLLIEVESVSRIGLFDMGYWGTSAEESSSCNCASPPCAQKVMGGCVVFGCVCLIFLVDFYLTRGFASSLRFQLRSIESSVLVSEDVAAALANYDVDTADTAIAKGENLPPKLKASYGRLLCNLRSYRAYLPHSCLVQHNNDEDEEGAETEDSPLSGSQRGSLRASRVDRDSDSVSVESLTDLPRLSTGLFSEQSFRQDTSKSFDRPERTKTSLKVTKKRCRASLAAGNMVGYLTETADLGGLAHDAWMSEDVEKWCSTVVALKGVVDLIGGDRRFASFNARQGCMGHASAALEALWSRGEGGEWSGCVVTGQAVCGDYGSSSVLRFMVLGRTPSSLYPLERIAAQWRIKALADAEAYSAACYTWDGKVLGAVFVAKRSEKPLFLYNMTSRRQQGGGGAEEWMYELEGMEQSVHEDHNKATKALIKAKLDAMETADRVRTTSESEAATLVWTVNDVGMDPC
eukprot:Hpha_TRINITY_DN16476_c5_g1::TRINITY_DN16476_c5_g1_i3::g.160562::m.160562